MARVDTLDTARILHVSQRHGVTFLALFGSTARGEARSDSDIDLLVAFESPKSLLDLAQIERELSEAVGHKVDLLTEGAVSPYMREEVQAGMRVLYDARTG
jgi:predicted nucleotidyltransferase